MSIFRRAKSTIQEALDVTNVGQPLQVHGWVKAARKQKANTFIDIDDGLVLGGKKLQLVIASHQVPDSLRFHSFIKAQGILKLSQHRGQEVELEVESIELVIPVEDLKYPFQPRKKYDDDLPRSYPQYRAKLNDFASLLRIRSRLSKSIHDYFHEQNFIQIHTPILTANDCEGAGELFQVTPANDTVSQRMQKTDVDSLDQAYFDKKVFLTVSGQLHLEAMCNGLEQVYTFSPAFRAEMGRTRRHLCEFSMIEAEKVIFGQDLDQLLQLQEGLIKTSLQNTLDSHEDDIGNYLKLNSLKHKSKQIGNDNSLEHVEKVLKEPFVVMTYAEAFEILDKHADQFEVQPHVSHGLGKEHELFLVQHCHQIPVFVINWPKKTKAFYARQCSDNDQLVAAVDLLFPSVGELAGGALREDKYEVLQKNLAGIKGLEWYLDLRCNGAAPMGGFGLGFERLIQFLLKVYNIRDTVPFSRRPHECRL